MASISSDPNGRRRIQFFDGDGKRQTIRLGKISKRNAEAVKSKVEDLVGAKITGQTPTDETSRWLVGLEESLYGKLARVGLIKHRGVSILGLFTRHYIDNRSDIKQGTRINLDRARTYLIDFYGADRPMREITPGDAEDFQQHMIRTGRAENTVRRAIGRARQFFTAAQKRNLIQSNPFEGIAATVKANPDRFHFVSREDAAKVSDACPDAEWRLIFALARYGGLRCPSEILALTWPDIDWERSRIRVPSPKTERHEGMSSRVIPLFPELHPHLLAAFDMAEEGSEYVITRYRSANSNLRTQLLRIIRRAGLEPWPKLFQNLRSTRETELADEFPMHVVCKWIGNSQPVAAKHYLQLTDEHFERAIGGVQRDVSEAAQNAAQQSSETAGNDSQRSRPERQQTPETSRVCEQIPDGAGGCDTGGMPCIGLEPMTR